ncbi:hypothetical protein SBC1_40310 (plasmid) [Caballeronia sp. SBC1]|nr:hypothetical protein SBC2_47570 [Caballeronia sp. SBC2]QIN63991.1 hypothetical protein SBC1_40310 [Caballeronia sp. SBC1]
MGMGRGRAATFAAASTCGGVMGKIAITVNQCDHFAGATLRNDLG